MARREESEGFVFSGKGTVLNDEEHVRITEVDCPDVVADAVEPKKSAVNAVTVQLKRFWQILYGESSGQD